MGYYIEIQGSFNINPPVDPSSSLASAFALMEWHVSQNGRQLFTSSGTTIKASTLEDISLQLKEAEHSLNGSAAWCGEDEATGRVSIENNEVTWQQDDLDLLSQDEIECLLERLKNGDEAKKFEAIEILDQFGVRSIREIVAISQELSDTSLTVRMAAAT